MHILSYDVLAMMFVNAHTGTLHVIVSKDGTLNPRLAMASY